MNLKYFIDRPILSVVISVVIVLLGLIGLVSLPVEQYPDIAPPTVRVSTTYSGANAEAVQNSVIVPLEEAINGVENMTYMESSASNSGSASISIYFKQGTDPDMAAVNVQNRVSRATSLLPAEVTRVGVETMKRQSSTLKIFALYSPDGTYDETFLTNYMSINIKPEIQRISGVGEANVMGGDYAMRIWMKPDIMAQYGLQPSDISAALSSQNIEASTGSIGEDSENVFQYTLKYRGRLSTEEEFGDIVIKALSDGSIIRMKDVADIELGAVSYSYSGKVMGAPGVQCMINQTSGSNANEIINEIDTYLSEVRENLPKGIVLVDIMSTKDFLDASIHEVIKTLLEAILLVVLVVLVFLSYMADLMVNNTKQAVRFTIFSKKWQDIATAVNTEAHRGCTILDGTGWYTKQEVKMLVVFCRKSEALQIYRIIFSIDAHAFVSEVNVNTVYGEGFDVSKVKPKSRVPHTVEETEDKK